MCTFIRTLYIDCALELNVITVNQSNVFCFSTAKTLLMENKQKVGKKATGQLYDSDRESNIKCEREREERRKKKKAISNQVLNIIIFTCMDGIREREAKRVREKDGTKQGKRVYMHIHDISIFQIVVHANRGRHYHGWWILAICKMQSPLIVFMFYSSIVQFN